MLPEYIIALLFLSVIILQAIHIKEIIIFERKTRAMYIATVVGCLILLGITLYYGSTFVHMITGLLGIIMLINSLFVTGLSKDSFFYYSPPKRLVGQKVLFNDSTKIRVETFHQNKLIVRFVAHSSAHFLTFSKKDADELYGLLDYNFQMIVKEG